MHCFLLDESEDNEVRETVVQICPGLQAVTRVLRRLSVWGDFFHNGEKVACWIGSKLSYFSLTAVVGLEDQSFVPLVHWVYCVILFAFVCWASSKFCHSAFFF